MSEFRCFDSFALNKFSSSDYIKKKKRGTLFTNAQTIAIGNANYQRGIEENSVPPGYIQKEEGGGTFFNPVYVGTTETSSRCLIGAHSYDVLYDVLYGAPPTNKKYEAIVQDIATAIPITSEGWTGNIMEIDFKDAPLGKVGPAISNTPNGYQNKMNYPARQDFLPKYDDPENPPTEFPGIIIDPSYNIFYPQCSSKFKRNNYLKNVRYNSEILFNGALSLNQTVTFLQNKLYQNVNKFPYPLDFSATSCVNQKIRLPSPTPKELKFYPTNNDNFNDFGNYIAYGNGVWIVSGGVGTDFGGINTILRSVDGINWSPVSGTQFTYAGLSVLYENNLWVAVGNGSNKILTSNNDGVTWSLASGTLFTHGGNYVTYGNGRWLAVGSGVNTILTSTNGVDWSPVSGTQFTYGGNYVTYGNGRWVAVGSGVNTILTSTNGVDWSPVNGTQFTGYGNYVTYGNGRWIAVGYKSVIDPIDNRILTSTNGVDWTTVNNQFTDNITYVTYGNGLWVAVASGVNTILTSNDGINWSPVNGTQFTNAGNYVTYGNGVWIAVGSGVNTILTSINGINWSPVSGTQFTSGDGYYVKYVNGVWIAAGSGLYKILYSN